MKKIILLFGLQVLAFSLFSQSPKQINYQGIARTADGNAIINQSIGLKFDLHQGSSTGTVAFTEQQSVATNSLGLFSTQIGKVNANGMNTLDWEAGPYFLEVSIDPLGGSSYTSTGTQQLSTVPYALYAQSVPATFTNNILTIGNKSFLISQTVTPTPNTSITVSGLGTVTTVGTNTFDINIPPPNFTGQGSTTVTGTYPNYSINTQSASAPTITGAGISTVSSTGNNFTVNVATPTITGLGTSTVSGSYPNYTVNSAIPTLTGAGTTTVSGVYPNYTITTPAAQTTTMVGSGLAVVSPTTGNNFTVTVPQPTFAYSQATGSLTSGTVSVYTTPNLSFTNNVLTSGPASNSVLISSGWGLTGNAATTPSLNFIGTTDNNALNFRVNNQKSGGIDHVLFNSSFGYQSYLSNITGSVNAAFGHQAMYSNTSGFRNAGFGYQALYSNTSGVNNTGLGYQALYGVSTGQSNVGIGFQALGNNNGSSNIGIGANAMLQNTSGQSNIAIGLLALYPNTNGNDNTLMGTQTFFNNTSGSSNVALGAFTGYSNVAGSGNVFLGKNAGYYEMGSNKLYISNTTTSVSPLIYGDFLTGNVGIGTTTANAPLQFNNSITGRKIVLWEGVNNDHQVYGFGLSNNILRYQVDAAVGNHVFYSGINSSSSLELMRIQGNGRVGINNAVPTATLDVNGTMKLVDGTQGAGKVLTSDAVGNASWQSAGGNAWSLTGNAGTSPGINFIGTTDNNVLNFRVANTKSGTIDNVLNNVFFGFQSGSSISTGSLNAGYGHQALKSNSTGGKNTAVGYLALNGNIGGNDNTAVGYSALQANANAIQNTAMGKDALYSNSTGSQNSAFGLGAMLSNVSGNSNVAVGKDVLSLKTSGDNNVALGYNAGYNNLVGSSNVFIGYQAGYNETGSNKLVIANSSTSVSPLIFGDFSAGMVGINTTAATGVLSIDNQSLTSRDGLSIMNARDQVGAGMPMQINVVTSGQTFGLNTYGRIVRLNNASLGQIYDMGIGSSGNFFLAVGNNYSPPAFNLANNGNIGIGASAPAYKLDIVGTGGPRTRVFSQDGLYAGYLSKNNTHEYFAGIQADYESAGGVTSGYHIYDNTAGAQRMVIDATGNMGVGNFNPSEKLEVAGNIQIPGANNYKYATAKTNYATISAASFASINGLLLDGNGTGNAKWIMNGSVGTADQLYGTIQIPNGATITAVTVYVTDNDGLYNLDAELVRFNMTSNIISTLGLTNATSGIPGLAAISATGLSSVVDNSNNSYFVQLNTRQNNPNLWIRGAKVTYIVDKAD